MTAELIVFPDPVEVVIAGLEARLGDAGYPGVPVSGWIPSPRPSRFVRAMRVGGVAESLVIDGAFVVVEAWAESAKESADLAAAARAVVRAMAGQVVAGTTVYEVEENAGPANLPDPESNQARHTMTFVIGVRGRAIA